MYIGFLADWAFELLGVMCSSFTEIAVGSLYTGLCLYTGGMVADLKAQMATFDQNTPVESTKIRSIYVKVATFHVNIME